MHHRFLRLGARVAQSGTEPAHLCRRRRRRIGRRSRRWWWWAASWVAVHLDAADAGKVDYETACEIYDSDFFGYVMMRESDLWVGTLYRTLSRDVPLSI